MCGACKIIRVSKPDLRNRLADSTKERWYNNIVLNIPHASVGGLGIARWDNKVTVCQTIILKQSGHLVQGFRKCDPDEFHKAASPKGESVLKKHK